MEVLFSNWKLQFAWSIEKSKHTSVCTMSHGASYRHIKVQQTFFSNKLNKERDSFAFGTYETISFAKMVIIFR